MAKKKKEASAKSDTKLKAVDNPSATNKINDELANVISDTLNKKFKEQGQVVFSLNDYENPSNIIDWVSFGNSVIDLIVSNIPHGGAPVGRMIEITGLESSGKSLLAGHLIGSTQKKGGIGVYIENETSLHKGFLTSLGVDTQRMMYINLDTVEDIFAAIEDIVIKVREKNKDKLVTIVVDSVAAATSKVEQEASFDKAGYNTTKAIVISQALRKLMPMIAKQRICLVMINQLRSKVGGLLMPGADPWTVPGGKAIGFHATTRLRVAVTGKIKMKIHGVDEIIGTRIKVKVVKSKLGPSHRDCEYEAYFSCGIKDYSNWIDVLLKYGQAEKVGMSYECAGEKFSKVKWEEVLQTDPVIREKVYKLLCDALVMEYDKLVITPENLIHEDDSKESNVLENAE